MGLFDKLFGKSSKQEESNENTTLEKNEVVEENSNSEPEFEFVYDEKYEQVIKEISNSAVKYAETKGYKLDFSEESINILEEYVIEDCRQELDKISADEELYTNWSITFGAYVGETLLRNNISKFLWHRDENNWCVLYNKESGTAVFPASKCYKRLKGNKEDGDGIDGFYKLSKIIISKK